MSLDPRGTGYVRRDLTEPVDDPRIASRVAAMGDSVAAAEQIRAVLDRMPAVIGIWDRDLINVYTGGASVEWFGRRPEEIRGLHARELLGDQVFELNLPYIRRVLAGVPQQFERTIVGPNGRPHYSQVYYTPDVHNGQVRGFFTLLTDITPRVETQLASRYAADQLTQLNERQRISSHLHQRVVQSLFGTALRLGMPSPTDGDVTELLDHAVESIDGAIRELRSAMGALREAPGSTPLQDAVEQVVRRAARTLGVAPTVAFAGELSAVDPGTAVELAEALSETLALAVRLDRARSLDVTVRVRDGQLEMRVIDEGAWSAVSPRGGLAELGERSAALVDRATALGGSFAVHDSAPNLSVLEWRIPVAPRS
jgi:PAS domain S-box-containing protein